MKGRYRKNDRKQMGVGREWGQQYRMKRRTGQEIAKGNKAS